MKRRTRTAAAVLAAAILCGAVPYTVGDTAFYRPEIIAKAEEGSAAETKLVASGAEYSLGDTIYFGGEDVYVIMNDRYESANNWKGVTRTFSYLEYRSNFHQYDVGGTGIWITSDELTPPPTGIKVSGSGTLSDPYTFSLIQSTGSETLSDGQYRQTAHKDGKYYNRFVFVVPKSEFEGKSKAKFTATYDGTEYFFETDKYYTGVISSGITYTPASDESVMFVVTVSSSFEVTGGSLVCSLIFE